MGIGLDVLVLLVPLFDVTLDASGRICRIGWAVGGLTLIGITGIVEMLRVVRCDMSIAVAVHELFGD